MAFLELQNVSKSYGVGDAKTDVLKDINLSIEEGEFVAIVGFSGSGKTTLISAMAGLIKPDTGKIVMKGKEIEGPEPERGVVFQNYSLMPWLSVAGNIGLAVDVLFKNETKAERRKRVEKYVDMVGLSHAISRKPAELSGGMRQRVMIAMALACEPALLIADEPTTALDVTIQAQILDLMKDIQEEFGMSVMFITHDMAVIAEMADRVVVMYQGQVVEQGPVDQIFHDPQHPYTRKLISAVPRIGSMTGKTQPEKFPALAG